MEYLTFCVLASLAVYFQLAERAIQYSTPNATQSSIESYSVHSRNILSSGKLSLLSPILHFFFFNLLSAYCSHVACFVYATALGPHPCLLEIALSGLSQSLSVT